MIPVEFPRKSMVEQQRQQISELQFYRLPNPIILGLENTIQKSSDYLFWSSIGSNVMDQRGGDGWYIGGIEVLAIRVWKEFFQIWDAGREDCSCSEQDHPGFHFNQKVSLEEQKVEKEDRLLRGRQIAFMICDYFRVTGAHDTVLDYADLFSVTLHERWCSGNRYKMGRNSIISDEDPTWRRPGKSVQIENTWVWSTRKPCWTCMTWKFIRKYRCPIIKIGDNCEEKHRSETTTTKLFRWARENWNKRSGQESKGNEWRWRRKRYLFTTGMKKGQCSKGDQCSFRHESNDRSQKPQSKAATPSQPSMSWGRSVSKKWSIQGKGNHGTVQMLFERYLHAIALWILASSRVPILTKQKQVAKPGTSVGSRIKRLTNNQAKSQRKGYYSHKWREGDDKNAVAIVKIVPQLGCVSQDSEAFVSKRRKQSRWNPMQGVSGQIRGIRFTQSTLRQASTREKKGPSLGKIQVKNPHQRSPHAMKFEDRSQWRDWKTTAMRPQQGMEPCQKHKQAQRKRQSYI